MATRATSGHDAENELYDRGAELVEAAAAIRRGAAAPAAARAVPALLGCVEVALGELKATLADLPLAHQPDTDRRVERMARGLANLRDALDDAEAAAGAARALVARITADVP